MRRLDPHAARAGMLGLLVVQAIIGYEWLMSGLTKLVRGGFPTGLAAELAEKSEGAASWYRAFLDSVVIPNGSTFGVIVIVVEVLVGLALVVTAGLWALRAERLGRSARGAMLLAIFSASIAGTLMNISFHLANGSAHPWLIPGDGFDEGVDLDSLMPLVQLVIGVVALVTWRRERSDSLRETDGSVPSRASGSPSAESASCRAEPHLPLSRRVTLLRRRHLGGRARRVAHAAGDGSTGPGGRSTSAAA